MKGVDREKEADNGTSIVEVPDWFICKTTRHLFWGALEKKLPSGNVSYLHAIVYNTCIEKGM